MVSTTSRLLLNLFDGPDLIDETKINENSQIIDDFFGTVICTSGTRPSSPYGGQAIYETDTRFLYIRNAANSAWTMVGNIPSVSTTSAIASPYVGQVVFVTTGNTFYRYTGVWTPYTLFTHSSAQTVSTAETTTSTSYTALTTPGPAVTLTSVGTQALVICRAIAFTTTGTAFGVAMSFAISGATTTASADSNAAMDTLSNAGYGATITSIQSITITPGTNTFTAQYKVSGGTGSFAARRIIVIAP